MCGGKGGKITKACDSGGAVLYYKIIFFFAKKRDIPIDSLMTHNIQI